MNDKNYVKMQTVWLLPIFILIGVMPLVFILDSTPQIVSDNSIFILPYEFFTAAKAKLIMFLGPACLICSFFCKYCNKLTIKQLFKEPLVFAVLAYFALAVLSSVFSKFTDISFYGITGRNEGMFVIACYFCFWLAVFIQIRHDFQLKALIGCFYFYIFISFIIGISQFLNNDILMWKSLEPFIVPSELRANLLGFNKEAISSYIYLTLLNPNYVGSMMGLATVVCFSIYIATSDIKYKVIHCIFASFSIFMLIGSKSRGGYIAAIVGLIFITVIFYKKIICNWKSTTIIIVAFISIFLTMNNYLDNALTDRFKTTSNVVKAAVDETSKKESDNSKEISKTETTELAEDILEPESEILSSVKNLTLKTARPTQLISDYDFNGNEIKAVLSNHTIFIRIENDNLQLFNKANKALTFDKIEDSNVYYILNNGYEGVYILWDLSKIIIIGTNQLTFKYENNNFVLISHSGQEIESINPPVFSLLEGRETMMSNRGYIWSRSIPMIKETLFLGHGPDTYIMYFPQYEYSAKNEFFGRSSIFIDKPHNMFIQTAINTGVVSLIALLVAYALYFIKLVELVRKKGIENKWVVYSACMGAGIIAYLVSGLVNDSVIFVAPLFWVIFGIGCAANRNALEDDAV